MASDTQIVIQSRQSRTGAYSTVEITTGDEVILSDTFDLIHRINEVVQAQAITPAEDAG